ncbi:MAG: cyclomaltodextrinase N-terminal domain-containing protein [Ignavibacteriales bacterium]|nr:cyclomaltodextrinase N-terminal domain-containing protein [Ignavibacteriales bacterium]
MKKVFLIFAALIITTNVTAQEIVVNKLEPPNWWVGMKTNKIQLMVCGENLNNISARFDDSKIKVKHVNKTANPSYTFIDIEIPINITPKDYKLILSRGSNKTSYTFPILKRKADKKQSQGFSSKDVIYLIMPDRFSNGDITNDSIPGYSDYMNKIPGQNRAGGDIQGMIDKLDYLKDLGITTIWSTPLTENNTFRSYHGYAATNFYKIDPRLGTNDLYKKFVDRAHKHDIKIILDHVSNHFSDDHVWMKNPPTPDWTNGTKEDHLNANHNKMIFTDIHADSTTIKQVERGWFVDTMPDLNQENPFVANYIIQNTIWWMEYAGIDGIREDTYPYNNQKFMARWGKTLLNEYPTINIVGEVMTGETDFLAGYQKDTFLPQHFNTYLPALTDFALRDVLIGYLQDRNNLYNIFNVLAKDFLYKDPNNLVTFADNHDLTRVMFYAKGNTAKAQIVYTILLTTRGIPQIFYGSEIGIVGGEGDGKLRAPFPGGFPNDGHNAFTSIGRTKEENNIYNFLKDLIQLRKKYPALAEGKLTHFPPVNDVYVYFRTLAGEKIMVVVNNNNLATNVDLKMMKNLITEKSNISNLRTGEKINLDSNLSLRINPVSAEIFKVTD